MLPQLPALSIVTRRSDRLLLTELYAVGGLHTLLSCHQATGWKPYHKLSI